VQNDADNKTLANTILAMMTGNLAGKNRPTNVLIDPATPDGAGSGLRGPSLVKCGNLVAVRQERVLQVFGHLSDALMQRINVALKVALDLP
jgi:mRNA-degrading endonuclease toxin of MazEF toxin-antitoxin module